MSCCVRCGNRVHTSSCPLWWVTRERSMLCPPLQTASGTKVFSASYDRSLRVSSVSLQSLSVGLSAVVMQSCSSSHGSVFLCLLFCYLCLWWWVLACWNHWWELACWNQPTVSAVVQFFWSVHVHGYCFFCCCNFSFLFFFLVFFLNHYTPFSKGQGCFFCVVFFSICLPGSCVLFCGAPRIVCCRNPIFSSPSKLGWQF